jgi:hypothetical protein
MLKLYERGNKLFLGQSNNQLFFCFMMTVLFYSGGAGFCSLLAVLGFVLSWRCWILFFFGSAGFCGTASIEKIRHH